MYVPNGCQRNIYHLLFTQFLLDLYSFLFILSHLYAGIIHWNFIVNIWFFSAVDEDLKHEGNQEHGSKL